MAPAPVSGIAGLTERQPDLCKASEQASRVGQPGSVIPTLGLTRTYRIVEFRGIEPQDYDPNRLVFRLDAAGIITKIDCG
ncbi:Peptidase inhibitor I78 family protein [Paracoccus nototheniae]